MSEPTSSGQHVLMKDQSKIKKATRYTTIVVNSRDRNYLNYPNSNHFRYTLRRPLTNVMSVELMNGTIPSYITALETSLNTTFSAYAKATMTRELKAGKLHAADAEQALLSNSGLGSLGQLLYQTTLGRDATDSEITTFKKLSKQGVYWRFQQTYIMGGQEFLNYAKTQPGTAPV